MVLYCRFASGLQNPPPPEVWVTSHMQDTMHVRHIALEREVHGVRKPLGKGPPCALEDLGERRGYSTIRSNALSISSKNSRPSPMC